MPKLKAAPSSKRAAKPKRKASEAPVNPEWDHLEERFQNLSSDFGKLAGLLDKDSEPDLA